MGRSRFQNPDFSSAEVIQWKPSHRTYSKGFKCKYSRDEFENYFKKVVPIHAESHVDRCWIIARDKKLVGYITIQSDKLRFNDDVKRLFRHESVETTSFPAIKISCLAVDKRTKGAGKRLVQWVISFVAANIAPNVGVRYLTVDALYEQGHYDCSDFYRKCGFNFVNPKQRVHTEKFRTMWFNLKPTIDYYLNEKVEASQ